MIDVIHIFRNIASQPYADNNEKFVAVSIRV